MLLYLCKAESYSKSMGKVKPCWIHRVAPSQIIWIDLSISESSNMTQGKKNQTKKTTPQKTHLKNLPQNKHCKKNPSYLKWKLNAKPISVGYQKTFFKQGISRLWLITHWKGVVKGSEDSASLTGIVCKRAKGNSLIGQLTNTKFTSGFNSE